MHDQQMLKIVGKPLKCVSVSVSICHLSPLFIPFHRVQNIFLSHSVMCRTHTYVHIHVYTHTYMYTHIGEIRVAY